jgi:hypothetical protein
MVYQLCSLEINKSLFTLRKIIKLLSSKKEHSHVPYRDSKLTCLLKPSLSGESYCVMVDIIIRSLAFLHRITIGKKISAHSNMQARHPKSLPTHSKTSTAEPKLFWICRLIYHQNQVKGLQQNLIAANKQIQLLSHTNGEAPLNLEENKSIDSSDSIIDADPPQELPNSEVKLTADTLNLQEKHSSDVLN